MNATARGDFTLAPPPPPEHAKWVIWRAVSEAEWQATVLDMARALGWRCWHPWTAIHSEVGFPDVMALRGNRHLALELKREGKHPTAEQRDWLQAFRLAGSEAYVVFPHDEDALERILD